MSLLEDPNEEIFQEVEAAILTDAQKYEMAVNQAIDENTNVLVHKRLLTIQRKINFSKIGNDIWMWFQDEEKDLLNGMLLVNKIKSSHQGNAELLKTFISQLKRNIWIELNNYLTPLEQIHVLNSIFYNYYGIYTEDLGTTVFDSRSFYLDTIFHDKLGNRFSIACLYVYICQHFDIPIHAIYLDNQELFLAYYSNVVFDNDYNIACYINPSMGSVLSHLEVVSMLKAQEIYIQPSQFKPISKAGLLALLLKQLQFSCIVEQDFATADFLKALNMRIAQIVDSNSYLND